MARPNNGRSRQTSINGLADSLILASALDVTPATVLDGDVEHVVTNYFGRPGLVAPGPQSFLAETASAEAVVRPHFHAVDQFQVFWRGGKFGRHVIEPLFVQYADAYTVYGPIVAGADGLCFMTVRAKGRPGTELHARLP